MNKAYLSKTSLTLYDLMSSITTTIMSEKGQIVIPKETREKLKLKKGDRLVLVVSDERILIEKEVKAKNRFEDSFEDILKLSESSLYFWNNKYDEVWDNV